MRTKHRTRETLEYEHLFLNDCRTPGESRRGLKEFLEFFNTERIHQGLDYQTPDAMNYGAFPVKGIKKRAVLCS
ncbi:MAG: transposase [Sphaerochaetaceae bacterium]|nr:transposase [Sphaerochaetaceae bacterium]